MDVACQAPLSMRLPRQEYWSGLPFPSPGGLPDLGTEPVSPALAHRLFITEPPGKPVLVTQPFSIQGLRLISQGFLGGCSFALPEMVTSREGCIFV